jgi:hypothetical protein
VRSGVDKQLTALKMHCESVRSRDGRGHWTDLCRGVCISAVGCYADEVVPDYYATFDPRGGARPVFAAGYVLALLDVKETVRDY